MSNPKTKPTITTPKAETVGPSLNQVVASKKAAEKSNTPSRSITVTASAKRRRAGFSFAKDVPVKINIDDINDDIFQDLMSDPVLSVELDV